MAGTLEDAYWDPRNPARVGDLDFVADLGDGYLLYRMIDKDLNTLYQLVNIQPGLGKKKRVFLCRWWPVEEDVLKDQEWVERNGDLESFARGLGTDVESLKAASVSHDVRKRAWLYQDIAEYFGIDNLDAYPYVYSKRDLEKLYPEYVDEQ